MRLVFLLVAFLCIDGVLLFTVLTEIAPVSGSYSKHIQKIIFLAVLGLLTVHGIVHFSKKENREPVRQVRWDDPDEKLHPIEYVLLFLFLGISFGLAYAADKYIYQPCRFPFAGDWDSHVRLTTYVFLGLAFVTGILINKVAWFSHHIGWLVTVSIATVLTVISLLVRYMCYSF